MSDNITREELKLHVDSLAKSQKDHSDFMQTSIGEIKTGLETITTIQNKQHIKIVKNETNIKWMGRIFTSVQAVCLAVLGFFSK
tara:strand:+ start:20049 stop:20300 length:252 start_codon:yes stop_codon:yes gene_type:complete